MVLRLFNLIGSLGIFLFGMRIMSDAIQKSSGEHFQNLLNAITSNRIKSVFTGLFITGVIQSSSATTVIVVSLVNAGLLSLTQCIGVIMGANIGTTFTGWIVSILGFKFKITAIALPTIAFSIPFLFSKYDKWKNIGEILIGFGLLFFGLELMKDSVPNMKNNTESLVFLTKLTNFGFLSIVLFVFVGAVLTIIIQSSSAAMAITITMAYKGWISFPIAAAIVLGENIGTTITAFLASLGMNVSARRAARSHLIFNLIGVLWMLILFYPFIWMIEQIIPGLSTDSTTIPVHLSAFHSIFNITNTFILIWFIPQIARLVEILVPQRESDFSENYKIKFINTAFPDFAEANLAKAKGEIAKVSEITYDMLLSFTKSLKMNKKELNKMEDSISTNDKNVDNMYEEISKFLASCRTEVINEKQAYTINSMLIIVSELKSISGSISNLVQILRKKEKKKLKFHKNAFKEIEEYTSEVLDFLKYNTDYLNHSLKEHDIELAETMENAINSKRDRLKKVSQNKMIKGADIEGELYYMDILKHLEHIGDFCLTISHSLSELK